METVTVQMDGWKFAFQPSLIPDKSGNQRLHTVKLVEITDPTGESLSPEKSPVPIKDLRELFWEDLEKKAKENQK